MEEPRSKIHREGRFTKPICTYTNLYSNHAFSIVGSTFSSLAQSYFYLLWKNELPSEVKSQETGFRHPVKSSMHGSARRHTAHPSETHERAVCHQMPQSVHKTQPLWYRVCPLFLLNSQLIKLNSQMVSQTTEDRKTEHLPTHFPECWGYEAGTHGLHPLERLEATPPAR